MIFGNVELHNVAELIPTEHGYRMSRVPQAVRAAMEDRSERAFHNCGVEVRFRIRSGEADVVLYSEPAAEHIPAAIYYGAFQGGWEYSVKRITPGECRIHIRPTPNLAALQRITREENLPFNPELVRLMLPCNIAEFVRVEGDVEPPHPGDAPALTYLSYGSSITHGSLALGAPHVYGSMIARSLNADHINLGFAGSACMEEEMAAYICARKDWSFASVEMGINMLGADPEVFRRRVRAFVDRLAEDGRPVFATNMFVTNYNEPERDERFRRIVREETAGKLIFTDGLELMGNHAFISEDLVHPSVEGHVQIAQRWSGIMKGYLEKAGNVFIPSPAAK